jgi:predicted nucleic acid-binding protein
LDATFLIDYLAGDATATEKAREWAAAGERITSPAPAVAEAMIGANFRGGAALREALAFLGTLEVLPADDWVAGEAGRMGAEQLRRGARLSLSDLLIAATARLNGGILVTRDAAFGQIPGLAVETY